MDSIKREDLVSNSAFVGDMAEVLPCRLVVVVIT
jgi:hypothetical protein